MSLETPSFEEVAKPEPAPGHLKEGIKPIFVCIGTEIDFNSQTSREIHPFNSYIPQQREDVDYVNFYMPAEEANKKNIRNAGRETYVISEANEKDKFSNQFVNCTSLIVAGTDKETGKNISILTHQNPRDFLGERNEEFIKDLTERLRELKSRCAEGTIDAIVAGGNYFDNGTYRNLKQGYINSINFLSEQVKGSLGFTPIVIAGPKVTHGTDALFYESANRRLYLIRPEAMKAKAANQSYRPEDLDKEKEKW